MMEEEKLLYLFILFFFSFRLFIVGKSLWNLLNSGDMTLSDFEEWQRRTRKTERIKKERKKQLINRVVFFIDLASH